MYLSNNVYILWVALGTPSELSVSGIRKFLREFLSDRRVVDVPRFIWLVILYFFILPFRPRKIIHKYDKVFINGRSLLEIHTEEFCQNVDKYFKTKSSNITCFTIAPAYMYGINPKIEVLLNHVDLKKQNKLVIIPHFPQYSSSTVASVFDRVTSILKKVSQIPDLSFLSNFYQSESFIKHSIKQIDKKLEIEPFEVLILSFHGIPQEYVEKRGDPYYGQCKNTFELIKTKIQTISPEYVDLAFQSRFGLSKWTGPLIEEVCLKWKLLGKTKIGVYCPSFVVDCLETVEEIGYELKIAMKEKGIEIVFIPCLNSDPEWCNDFANELMILYGNKI